MEEMILSTVKDLKDFKLKINLKITELNNNELAREWIINNYYTEYVNSIEPFIFRDGTILIKVMSELYVVLPFYTENDFIEKLKNTINHGK